MRHDIQDMPPTCKELGLMSADDMLAERGEVAVNCEELDELRSLAASGSDSAELAQETADLIALLHQARSSNASVSSSQQVPCGISGICCTWHLTLPSLMIKLDGLG